MRKREIISKILGIPLVLRWLLMNIAWQTFNGKTSIRPSVIGRRVAQKTHFGLSSFRLFVVLALILSALGHSWVGAPAQSHPVPQVPLGVNFVISADAGRDAIGGRPAIAGDGTSFFVVWRDSRDFATNGYDIYGARVTHEGTVLDPSGIPISTFANYDPSPGNQYTPSVAFDGTNYLVVWTANRAPSSVDYEIYAARVTPDGTVLDPEGLQLTSGADPLRMSSIVFDGTNYFITWRTQGSQIRGARVSTIGDNLDDPTGFFIGTGFYPYVAYDGTNYMVVWHKWGNGLDIVGARVTRDGDVLGSFPICTADDDQDHASVAFDGTNYLVAWNDRRGGNDHNDGGAYGTRVSPDGTVLDSPALKIGECAASGVPVVVAFDGTDYLVVWQMSNYEPYFRLSDVYGRRVSKDGVVLDEQGIPIATAYGHQWGPVSGFDTDRYLIAWSESLSRGRSWEGAVYGQLLQVQTSTQSSSPPSASNQASGGWTMEDSPTSQALYSIWGFDESKVYAAGYDSVVIRYNGSQWLLETELEPSRGYDLWGIGADDLWVMGGWAWFVFHYNGETWSSWGVGPHHRIPGLGLWGTDNSNIITVGVDGRLIQYDGLDWNEKPTGVSVDLSDAWGTSDNNAYAVGEFGTIIRYDGTEWSRESNVPTIQRLNGIWGSSADNVLVVGDFGTILHYDGISWSSQESGTTKHLYGVWCSDGSNAYAVGHNGTILSYDGNEWHAETSGTSRDIFAVAGTRNCIWAVGDYGTILKKTQPDIRTPIDPVDFGEIAPGTSRDEVTTIYNDGTATLTVNSITRSSGSEDFSYIGPATPFDVGADSSQVITIRFVPTSIDFKSATFAVSSNDPDEPDAQFNVSGNRLSDPPHTPSNPSPANNATGVSINTDLSWIGGDPDPGDTVTYDIYFGVSSPPPFEETIGPDPATQTSITYDLDPLDYDTTYYWKIVAWDNHGITRQSDTWSFTTEEPPSRCFIATAAYGTPMAEEIQILREFRDGYLLTNPVGQAFVDLYYKVSPPMAEFITEHPSLKPIVRTGLVPAVTMSAVVVNTTPAQKTAVAGLLVLVSVAVGLWATRRRGRGQEYA